MLVRKKVVATLMFACAMFASGAALAQPLRIGVIASYSGPYADYGRQFDAGIELYLREHDGKIAGRDVDIVRKDTGGPEPKLARRYAQELIARDKVSFLAGLDFSPNAYAVATVATQARVPTIVMNAASSAIPLESPYMARVAFTVPQVSAPMARWALANGITEVYTVVADYASGVDAETAFSKAFVEGGGKVAGSLRTPMNNPDFSAYAQRIKDEKPQAVFIFFPSGIQPPAFLKAFNERGLAADGIRLIATGEATDDAYLQATGDVALGLVTSHHYSYAHPSELNRRFIEGIGAGPAQLTRPSYFAVAAYDGLAALDRALQATGGDTDGDAIMAALAGLSFESPRGPIMIDPATRDIVQNVYIRRVEQVEGELVNVEFDQFEQVKDPTHP